METSHLTPSRFDHGDSGSPLVSVVVPAYNYARYLAAAVESVRAQTFIDWECLIVDDGSTDETPTVVATLAAADPRIRYVARPRSGVSAARNVGLALARGALIQFLDADDLLHPGKLDKHVAALTPDVDIVYGRAAFFDDDTPEVVRTWHRGPETPPDTAVEPGSSMLSRLLVVNPMVIEAPLARSSVLTRAGGFDEALERMEDWDLWLRCALDGARFAAVGSREPVALVRVHPASVSHRQASMYLAEVVVRRRIADRLTLPIDREVNERRIDEARAQAGKRIGLEGNPRAGLEHLLPATLARRRPAWIAWTAVLLIMRLPGGTRLVRRLRDARKSRG